MANTEKGADGKKASPGKQTDSKKNKKPNVFAKIGKFFSDSWAEISKIVWPTVAAVRKNTGTVLIIILIMGAFIIALDYLLTYGLGMLMNTTVSAV